MSGGKLKQKVQQERAQDALLVLIQRVRQSLELQDILSTTVRELKAFLKTDRVKIYQFDEDGNGQVVAEAVDRKRLPALKGLHFPAFDIPPHARELFVKTGVRTIVNLDQQKIRLSQPGRPKTTAVEDLSLEEVQRSSVEDILERAVDPCHVEYLTRMGVKSTLVVPILHQQKLWGLLISHHGKAHKISNVELRVVQALVDQVAIAISQSALLSQAEEKARREALINQISTLLHTPIPIQQILQIALEQVAQALGASGGRLYLMPSSQNSSPELYVWGTQPHRIESFQLVEESPLWQHCLASSIAQAYDHQGGDHPESPEWAVPAPLHFVADLYQEAALYPIIPAFQPTQIRSLLVMPLTYAEQVLGCLTLFRNQVDTDIVWAGKFDSDQRQNRVRESFAAWRQLKQGQTIPWTLDELGLVRSLGIHLTLAITQHRLYQCEREQRVLVEMRNQELNTARTVAEEANNLKSNFLASTSHELRTPLASTLNYLKLLKEGLYDTPDELQEYIDIAHKSAENLVGIINDVLDIAKIEAGRMSADLEWISLLPLLEEQDSLFRLESRRKAIALAIDCNVTWVYADVIKLRQVLTNLLANAFKFTSTGEIRITADYVASADPTVGEARISVKDSGIGIDPAKKELLFEPFVQADGSIKRRYGGTGLGLTICRSLVEVMHGRIWLESAGIGQGTTVFFTLPSRLN